MYVVGGNCAEDRTYFITFLQILASSLEKSRDRGGSEVLRGQDGRGRRKLCDLAVKDSHHNTTSVDLFLEENGSRSSDVTVFQTGDKRRAVLERNGGRDRDREGRTE